MQMRGGGDDVLGDFGFGADDQGVGLLDQRQQVRPPPLLSEIGSQTMSTRDNEMKSEFRAHWNLINYLQQGDAFGRWRANPRVTNETLCILHSFAAAKVCSILLPPTVRSGQIKTRPFLHHARRGWFDGGSA
jgi:hypothetical protein